MVGVKDNFGHQIIYDLWKCCFQHFAEAIENKTWAYFKKLEEVAKNL